MKTYLDCFPCFIKQSLEFARLAGANEETQKKVIDKVARTLPKFVLTSSPPETGRLIYRIVKKITGKNDPYKKIKEKSNKLALSIYGALKRKLTHSNDRMLTAIELAIAGNIIDYGAKNTLNIEEEIAKILKEEYKSIKDENKAIFDYAGFKKALKKAKTILYLADNAGETVFDKLLIEEIIRMDKNKKIIYVVKEKPIINDALEEDAAACGLDKITEVMSSGLDTPGTILRFCNKYFLKEYKQADMVISKGQGNFEALSDSKRPVYFLLMAKCPVIAKHICSLGSKCKVGDIILYYQK
ncbi:MAG: DUF89 family protein [Endomicrobiales bacterium]|nr:DUF89 family protein [Endomicrobiales bacterium]